MTSAPPGRSKNSRAMSAPNAHLRRLLECLVVWMVPEETSALLPAHVPPSVSTGLAAVPRNALKPDLPPALICVPRRPRLMNLRS